MVTARRLLDFRFFAPIMQNGCGGASQPQEPLEVAYPDKEREDGVSAVGFVGRSARRLECHSPLGGRALATRSPLSLPATAPFWVPLCFARSRVS